MHNFNEERLRDIRLFYGYTTEEAAGLLGITKQAFSKYETGKMMPSTDILVKLLSVFDISVQYLTKSSEIPADASPVFYRKNSRTPKKELAEAGLYMRWAYEIIRQAEGYGPFHREGLELPAGLTAAEAAGHLRARWELGDGPIGDIASLLGQHGVFLFGVRLKNREIDGYSQLIGDTPIIIMNREKGNHYRRNFSLAHELGHLVLHRHMLDYEAQRRMEQEADDFAAHFLMPDRGFTNSVLRADLPYIQKLGELWQVSVPAVIERMRNLSLFSGEAERNQAKAEQLFQQYRVHMRDPQAEDKKKVFPGCNISDRIDDIFNKKGTEFLNGLCLPRQGLIALGVLQNGPAGYDQEADPDEVDDIEGAQLSFSFT